MRCQVPDPPVALSHVEWHRCNSCVLYHRLLHERSPSQQRCGNDAAEQAAEAVQALTLVLKIRHNAWDT